MKFGNYAIINAVTYYFEKEPDWYWMFKPPTAKNELELQQFLFQGRTRTANGVSEQLPATSMEIVFEQLALTFGGTNIPKYKEQEGEWVATEEPVLKASSDIGKIKEVLGDMPTVLVQELWKALGKHVPDWGPIQNDPKD